MQFVDVKTDIAFKKIFGSEQHKEILISFLNAVLDLNGEFCIQEVSLKNPWQAPDIAILKETILDIKAVDGRGITFIIEMQVRDNPYFDKRALYYSAKAYTGQIARGDDYPKLNQVIFIGILNFNSFEGDNYITHHLILNKETLKCEIPDLEFNFIELRKFNKSEEQLESIIDKWIYFIKNAGNLSMIPQNAENIIALKEAYTIAEMNTWSKEDLEIYEYWQIRDAADKYGMEEKFVKSKLKGKLESKIEIAIEMIKNCETIEKIIKYTGLTRSEIETLQD